MKLKLILSMVLFFPAFSFSQSNQKIGMVNNALLTASTEALISTLAKRLNHQQPSKIVEGLLQNLCHGHKNPSTPPPQSLKAQCRIQYDNVNGQQHAAFYLDSSRIALHMRDQLWGMDAFNVMKQYVDQGICQVQQPCIERGLDTEYSAGSWGITIGQVPVNFGWYSIAGPQSVLNEYRQKGYCR